MRKSLRNYREWMAGFEFGMSQDYWVTDDFDWDETLEGGALLALTYAIPAGLLAWMLVVYFVRVL